MKKGRRTETDIEKDVRALTRYLGSPRTVIQIRERFGISRATVYRWLDRIQETDRPVYSDAGSPAKYSILP